MHREARRRGEQLDDGRRRAAAHEQQLERAVQVDHERRPEALDSAISACVSGSDPACVPGDERFVRFSGRRSSGSMPGG